MCHDINPLGTTMHLKELDRQASVAHGRAARSVTFRGERRGLRAAASATAAAVLALLVWFPG